MSSRWHFLALSPDAPGYLPFHPFVRLSARVSLAFRSLALRRGARQNGAREYYTLRLHVCDSRPFEESDVRLYVLSKLESGADCWIGLNGQRDYQSVYNAFLR